MIARPLRYSLSCALVLAALAWLASRGARVTLLEAAVLIPAAAWPFWLAPAHRAATAKAHARALLERSVWWGPFLGGALLRQVAAVPLALLAAWSLGWWLLSEGWAALAWIAMTALVLRPMAWALSRQAAPLRPYARLAPVLLWAPLLAAGLLTALWLLVTGLSALGQGTLAARVAAEPRYEGASALLAWAADGMGLLNGARAWGLAWADGQGAGPLVALWRLGGVFGQFWLAAGVFAGLLLPPGEARRILQATEDDRPPSVPPSRAALAGFLLAVLSAALASTLAEAETWAMARHRPEALADLPALSVPETQGEAPSLLAATDAPPMTFAPALPTPSALRRIVEAERIGDLACAPGTIARIEALDLALRELREVQRSAVEAAARGGFDAMRARVPAFLDGYYSLTAEYVRTYRLVAGDADAFLQAQMTEALDMEASFAPFQLALSSLAEAPAELATREGLLADCDRLPPDDAVLVVTETRPEDLLALAPELEAIPFEARLAASGTGAAAGGIAGAVAGKLLAKEAFGLAADAVAKLAVAKAAGGLGGAAAGAGAGALAGSVVPGLGTTVGAAVGGVLGGLAVGVATDYALIRIEEAVSRETFEAEIMAALDEAEAAFLAELLPE